MKKINNALDSLEDARPKASAITTWPSELTMGLKNDVERWVLPNTKLNEIRETVRNLATTRPQQTAQAKDLADLEALRGRLCGLAIQAIDIFVYWQQRVWIERLQRERLAVLAGYGQIDSKLAQARDFDSEIQRLVATGNFDQAIGRAAVWRVFEEAHSADTFKAAGSAERPSVRLPAVVRDWTCPSPVAPVADTHPKLIALPGLGEFYPMNSRQRGEKGTVMVLVRIDPGGCAVEALVVLGSGHVALDQAALRAALAGQYRAGQLNGTAIEGTITYKVHFGQDLAPRR
ncbi:MAG: energy transducer TonB [Steroidobacteraceae bacterium]